MASTPILRGADVHLYAKTESAFGTAPAGNYAQLPFITLDVGGTAPLEDDIVLSGAVEVTRDATGQGIGRSVIGGNVVVPVDLQNFGTWLNLLFGAATVTDADPNYTHTWVSGGAALPSVALEKAMSRITQFGMLTGIKANSLALVANTETRPRATIGLMGKAESFSGSSGAGTPTFAGMTKFHQKQYTITKGGSAFPNIREFTLNYANSLEAYYDLNSADTPTAIDEGRATCSGSFTARVSADAVALIADAVAETSAALVLKMEIGATQLLQFTIHDALFSRPTVGFAGPGGTEMSFDFVGRYSASGGEMLEVVLKNQVAAYA